MKQHIYMVMWFLICIWVLLYGSVVHADFIVQPMKISETSEAGKLIHTKMKLINRGQDRYCIAVKTIELAQKVNGRWIPIDPDIQDVNQSDLVTKLSCRHWISLQIPEGNVITVEPSDTNLLYVTMDIPKDAHGLYWAAVKFSLLAIPGSDVDIKYDFIVPVILDIGTIEEVEEKKFLAPLKQFAVYPMIYSLQSRAGMSMETKLHLESLVPDVLQHVTLETIDLLPSHDGQWLPIETDKRDPNLVARLNRTSCRDWISLGDYQGVELSVPPLGVQSLDVDINIPSYMQGRFYAGIKVRLLSGPTVGISTIFEFIVPVLIEVKEAIEAAHSPKAKPPLAMIKCKIPFPVTQDMDSEDPYHTYIGQKTIEVCSDLTSRLMTSVRATSAAEGHWTSLVTPTTIVDKQTVDISVRGMDVIIENLVGGSKRVIVGALTVTIMPDLGKYNIDIPDEPAL